MIFRLRRMKIRPKAFTLIELLTTLAVMAVLAGILLGLARGVGETTARCRAQAEISALQAALTSFREENEFLPTATNIAIHDSGTPDARYDGDGLSDSYFSAGAVLFSVLMGRQSWDDAPSAKQYIEPQESQILTRDGRSAFHDPWGNFYGYYYTSAQPCSLHHPTFYDLWSTGGSSNVNNWIP